MILNSRGTYVQSPFAIDGVQVWLLGARLAPAIVIDKVLSPLETGVGRTGGPLYRLNTSTQTVVSISPQETGAGRTGGSLYGPDSGDHLSRLSTQETGAGRTGGPLFRLPPKRAQYFEEALLAKLQALPDLAEVLGKLRSGIPGIFKSAIPQTWDLGHKGAAVTYSIPTKPRGHVLTGSDGTVTARVQLDVWSYSESTVKMAVEAIANGIDGVPDIWGDGTCQIMSVVQQDEIDEDEQPKAGSDQWTYHTIAEYSVKYRVPLPPLE